MGTDSPNYDAGSGLPVYNGTTGKPIWGAECEPSDPCADCTGNQTSITVTDPDTCASIIVGAYSVFFDGGSTDCSWSGGGGSSSMLLEFDFGLWNVDILDSNFDHWIGIDLDLACVAGVITGTGTVSFGGCDAAISFG